MLGLFRICTNLVFDQRVPLERKPGRPATYSDKALAEMLGLFRLRYYFGLYDQRAPFVCGLIECKPSSPPLI
ncbi:hypothetical protein THOE12_180002 [Vibrio rotiferianus]|nr:hypothetical protein THOE12_180002 [Vibrio rotiferianus]